MELVFLIELQLSFKNFEVQPLILDPIEPNSSESAMAERTIGDSGTEEPMKDSTPIF